MWQLHERQNPHHFLLVARWVILNTWCLPRDRSQGSLSVPPQDILMHQTANALASGFHTVAPTHGYKYALVTVFMSDSSISM